ncbi:hypothetical protein EI94DRAFT_421121 [Lactarius quietus]|nr:hypothetical protein EI94DRAFT_421121 [Lactarius quietus]
MRKLAEVVPRLIHLSLCFFFFGPWRLYANYQYRCWCYLHRPYLPLWIIPLQHIGASQGPPVPYKTFISRPIFFLMQKFPRSYFGARFLHKRRKPTTIGEYQKELVMEETEERKKRDVGAIRWLVDNTAATGEIVLAMPGTFNTEWDREV